MIKRIINKLKLKCFQYNIERCFMDDALSDYCIVQTSSVRVVFPFHADKDIVVALKKGYHCESLKTTAYERKHFSRLFVENPCIKEKINVPFKLNDSVLSVQVDIDNYPLLLIKSGLNIEFIHLSGFNHIDLGQQAIGLDVIGCLKREVSFYFKEGYARYGNILIRENQKGIDKETKDCLRLYLSVQRSLLSNSFKEGIEKHTFQYIKTSFFDTSNSVVKRLIRDFRNSENTPCAFMKHDNGVFFYSIGSKGYFIEDGIKK